MSDETVEYCPWCGGEASRTVEKMAHTVLKVNKCTECETVFRVEVPHQETNVEWTEAR